MKATLCEKGGLEERGDEIGVSPVSQQGRDEHQAQIKVSESYE
jgi:hypothetical protein